MLYFKMHHIRKKYKRLNAMNVQTAVSLQNVIT